MAGSVVHSVRLAVLFYAGAAVISVAFSHEEAASELDAKSLVAVDRLKMMKPPVSSLRPKVVDQRRTGVHFSCDDEGWLFVNGVYRARTVGGQRTFYKCAIYKGDTITIQGANTRGTAGCSAVVVYRNTANGVSTWGTSATSSFKAKVVSKAERRNPKLFRDMGDFHCSWKSAVRAKGAQNRYLILNDLKSNNYRSHIHKVYPIWASTGERAGQHVAIRTVVGITDGGCGKGAFAAADNKLWMFVNGKLVLDVHNWHTVGEVRRNLKKGDIVAVKVQDLGVKYGFASFIRSSAGIRKTSSTKDWIAAEATPANMKKNEFAAVRYPKACSWKAPVKNPLRIGAGAAPWMKGRADYVWPRGLKGKTALFRTKIGGDIRSGCGTSGKGGQSGTKGVTTVNQKRTGVHFSCDDRGYLYVNGEYRAKAIGGQRTFYKGAVYQGDTITIRGVNNKSGTAGCSAVIVYRNSANLISTWGTNAGTSFKAKALSKAEARNPKLWRGLGDQHCSWKSAVRAKGAKRSFRIASNSRRNSFRPRNRGVYPIWASARGKANQQVAIRVVVGIRNDGCGTGAYVAADNKLSMFVNGKLVRNVQSWRAVGEVRQNLKKGDIVAVKVVNQGGRYGFASFIRSSAGILTTSSYKDWIAAEGTPKNMKKNAFAAVKYPVACSWKTPMRTSYAQKAPWMRSRAAYVWPRGYRGKIAVFRTRIGGNVRRGCGSVGIQSGPRPNDDDEDEPCE